MNIIFSITPNPKIVMKNIADDYVGARRAGMINLLATVEALAVKNAPVRTGNLARTRTTSVLDDGLKGILAFTAPYAFFVHEGTGLFGIYHRRIVPTNKKALKWPGSFHPYRSTKGMVGRPWVLQAIGQVDETAAFEEGMRNYLSRKG